MPAWLAACQLKTVRPALRRTVKQELRAAVGFACFRLIAMQARTTSGLRRCRLSRHRSARGQSQGQNKNDPTGYSSLSPPDP